MSRVEIVVLVEDTVHIPKIRAEHGLSLYVDTGRFRLLFDTGASALFLGNAKQLGIRLHDLDALILSHNHYDHTGGVEFLVDLYSDVPAIYGHPKVFEKSYAKRDPQSGQESSPRAGRPIGFPYPLGVKDLQKRGVRVTMNREPLEVGEGVWLSGEIPCRCPFEEVEKGLFLDPELSMPDTLSDDQALILREDKGLIVLTGCCHRGLVNTLEAMRALFPAEPLWAIVGGFHLLHADKKRIRSTLQYLKEWKPELILAGHCTGFDAMCGLRRVFGKRLHPLSVGKRFVVQDHR